MKTALLFPGQGAQTVGMGRDFAEADPALRAWYDRAGEILELDLAHLCFEGPIEELTRSDRAQPALFVTSVVAVEALRKDLPVLDPVACAGLSSGEWAALYFAGAVTFDDAVRILAERGRLMQAACRERPGGMLSILGLPAAEVEAIAARTGVTAANYNSPEQTVVAGSLEDLDRAAEAATAAGARRALRLQVAGAFHSPFMQGAARALAAFLETLPLQPTRIPVYSNVTGQPHGMDPAALRARMIEQISAPVRWVDCMQGLASHGVPLLECGPGRVLAGLAKRIDKTLIVHTIGDRSSLEQAAAGLAP